MPPPLDLRDAKRLEGASAASLVGTADPRPQPAMFLFPGAFGDEPTLKDFRDRFGDRLSFELIDHPTLDFSNELLSDMDALAARAAELVTVRQPEGPIHLAGLSFGGMVAAATASLLTRRGRSVAFLGVLDPPLDVRTVKEADEGDIHRSRTARVGRTALKWAGATEGTRQIAGMLGRLTYRQSNRARSLERYLVFHCFGIAMENWKPTPLPFEGVLVTSRGLGPLNRARWLRIAPRLRHVDADCRHLEILEEPSIETIVRAFDEAIGDSRQNASKTS